jgi:hypothetical protein
LNGMQDFETAVKILKMKRCGRPTAVRTTDTIETVRELISTDRRMTLPMMEEKLEISRETIRKISLDDLHKREICARFVLHCLSDEQKSLRLEAC